MASSAKIRAPTHRVCESCGRREAWDVEQTSWVINDGAVGEPLCIHEWDINGTFSPYA